MTVGQGIFWSTVVIVVFASIVLLSKYKRWRAFWKTLGSLVVVGVLVCAGVWFYFQYQNRPHIMHSLNGVRLGMTEVEVTLARGKPDRVLEPEQTSEGFKKLLIYGGTLDSFTYAILRGELKSMVVTDVCDKGGYGKALGFGRYNSEKELLEKLGEPARVSINEHGTSKILSYPQWQAAFEIEQGSISKVCITNLSQMRYASEYRNPQE